MITLRAYQADAHHRVGAAFAAGASTVLLRLPTGAGKTAIGAVAIADEVAAGRRAVFVAHLDALIDDTSERLTAAGIDHGIVQASRPASPNAPIQVCSLATLYRRGVYPPADLVVVDEAHRCPTRSVRAILASYRGRARILGLTATAMRADGLDLGFDEVVQGPTARELIDLGWLVPADVFCPNTLRGRISLDPVVALQRFASGVPAMVFCRNVAHAREVHARIGPGAVLVLGSTSRKVRREARARLADGEPVVLVGCGVFVEGWDSPEVRTVVLARPFGWRGAFLQATGRPLRAAPGKTRAIIVDLAGSVLRHGLPEDQSIDARLVDRCDACLLVMRVGPRECPRCGALVGTAALAGAA